MMLMHKTSATCNFLIIHVSWVKEQTYKGCNCNPLHEKDYLVELLEVFISGYHITN